MRFLAALFAVLPLCAQSPDQQLAREIFKQLIEINTTDSAGDNTRAAEAMAARFRSAGFPARDVQVLAPVARKGNLVVRLLGTGTGRPILFLGHLDVVEARRADWPSDPFVFREEDGYFYGRGTADMKGDDAAMVTAFLRMKREKFQPSRDLILALTSDEEGGPANGVEWLVKQHRDLIDAQFCVNTDAGGGHIKNGKPIYMAMQAAEKVYLSFKLEVTNKGGHSSVPTRDNAIYRLANGLARLGRIDFPVHLFDVTRTAFERGANIYGGQLGADLKTMVQNPNDAGAVARLSAIPFYNAQMRTTCVPTMLSGGHAENALPQQASAVVNCRLLPIDRPDEVKKHTPRDFGGSLHHRHRNEPARHHALHAHRLKGDGRRYRQHQQALARNSRDPRDGHGRHRRHLSDPRRHSHVWRERNLQRRGRLSRPWPERTNTGEELR